MYISYTTYTNTLIYTLHLCNLHYTGTSPVDGIALLASVIKHFITYKAKTLLIMHYTEVLHTDILPPDLQQVRYTSVYCIIYVYMLL